MSDLFSPTVGLPGLDMLLPLFWLLLLLLLLLFRSEFIHHGAGGRFPAVSSFVIGRRRDFRPAIFDLSLARQRI